MPWQLVTILILAVVVRLPYISSPFIRAEEWGCSMFSVYALNYQRLGFWECGLYPVYGKVADQAIPYVNHPPGGPLLLGVWSLVFGTSEMSSRVLAITISLLTVWLVYLLAKALFNTKTGLVAAGFYAFMPLSIYMGRVYSMEPPQHLFFLASLLATWNWLQSRHRGWLAAASAAILLSAFQDFYPIYLSGFCLLFCLTEKDKQRKIGWLWLAALPPLSIALHIAYISWWDWLTFMGQGGSKYSKPWEYWFRAEYYQSVGRRLFFFLGGIPTLLVPVAFYRQRLKGDVAKIMILLWSMAFVDFAILGRAVYQHEYRILFFMVPVAVTAASWLSGQSHRTLIASFTAFLALAYPSTHRLFQPINERDHQTALQIRELTTDSDILIGLPPHMTYYCQRVATVPYYYLWRHSALYGQPEELMKELRGFGEVDGYRRIVLFKQFLVDTDQKIDWSKTYDGNPKLRRVTRPELDPQVWEFVTDTPKQQPTPTPE